MKIWCYGVCDAGETGPTEVVKDKTNYSTPCRCCHSPFPRRVDTNSLSQSVPLAALSHSGRSSKYPRHTAVHWTEGLDNKRTRNTCITSARHHRLPDDWFILWTEWHPRSNSCQANKSIRHFPKLSKTCSVRPCAKLVLAVIPMY